MMVAEVFIDGNTLLLIHSTEGCPRGCNNRGMCVYKDTEWRCECNQDFDGVDCSIPLERDCSDKKDNDGGKAELEEWPSSVLIDGMVCFFTRWFGGL